MEIKRSDGLEAQKRCLDLKMVYKGLICAKIEILKFEQLKES